MGSEASRYSTTPRRLYAEHVLERLRPSAEGMKVLLDCANGAAYEAAPLVFGEVGADLTLDGVEPTGTNINDGCGSTHVDELDASGHDVAFAFDGDADRVLAVDEKGNVVDGDRIIAILARDMQERGVLAGGVVVTVMSNLGFFKAMEALGIPYEVTDVGDRHVAEAMGRLGASVGGEQSGHVILSEHVTTGDGMVTALALLDVMARSGKPLSELAAVMEKYPQTLINVRVDEPGAAKAVAASEAVGRAVSEAEEQARGGRARPAQAERDGAGRAGDGRARGRDGVPGGLRGGLAGRGRRRRGGELEVCGLRPGVEAGRGAGEGLVPGGDGRAGEHYRQLLRGERGGHSGGRRGLRRGSAGRPRRRRRAARGPEREGDAQDRTHPLQGGPPGLLGEPQDVRRGALCRGAARRAGEGRRRVHGLPFPAGAGPERGRRGRLGGDAQGPLAGALGRRRKNGDLAQRLRAMDDPKLRKGNKESRAAALRGAIEILWDTPGLRLRTGNLSSDISAPENVDVSKLDVSAAMSHAELDRIVSLVEGTLAAYTVHRHWRGRDGSMVVGTRETRAPSCCRRRRLRARLAEECATASVPYV